MEDQEAPNGRPDLSAGEQPDTEIRPGREFKQWKMKRGLYDDEDDENANPLGDRLFQDLFQEAIRSPLLRPGGQEVREKPSQARNSPGVLEAV